MGTDNQANITVPIHMNGKEVQTQDTFDVVNPTTGKVIWKSAAASKEDAIRAIESAEAAFPSWSKTKLWKRRDIILKAADIFERRSDELASYMETETGAGYGPTWALNIPVTIEMLRDVAGRMATITAQSPVCFGEGISAMVYKEPYGVILGIAPWNAPYILGFRACIYALAAGNTVVLRAPELSPRCFWAIGSILKEAGLPDGCLNVLALRTQDSPKITTAMIEHPAIKKVNFTGSTNVGSIIAATAGKNLKPVLMELGGKASALVLEDADLELAARECVKGAFLHSGQVCMSTERILVHTSVASAFTAALKSAITTMHGPNTPAFVLSTPSGVQRSKSLLNQAVSKGAKVIAGDINAEEASDTRLRPIVVENVTKDMDLFYQESFGPSVSLYHVDSEEEALRMANDTEYGLTAAVFTRDLAKGLRIAKEIESGAVHINSMTIHDEPALPHGGVKKSGWGRFNASHGLEEFLRPKTVTWQD